MACHAFGPNVLSITLLGGNQMDRQLNGDDVRELEVTLHWFSDDASGPRFGPRDGSAGEISVSVSQHELLRSSAALGVPVGFESLVPEVSAR
jgi:hypothetical protein